MDESIIKPEDILEDENGKYIIVTSSVDGKETKIYIN